MCAVLLQQRSTLRPADYEEFGTRGHVDMVACFSDAATVLYHEQQNPDHPDHALSAVVKGIIVRRCRQQPRIHVEQTAAGFKAVPVPAPTQVRDDDGFVDFSYINHYIVNGGVILCGFGDPNDAVAKAILEGAYPGRRVVLVEARPIFQRGGGIHCITQQQPKGL